MAHTAQTEQSSFSIEQVNAMPAPTWYRLQVNDTTITVPCGLSACSDIEIELNNVSIGSQGAFEEALKAYQQKLDAQRTSEADSRAVVRAAQADGEDVDNLDIPALSAYQKRTVSEEIAGDVAQAFETGMGDSVTQYLNDVTQQRMTLVVDEGISGSALIRIVGHDACVTALTLDVVVAPHAQLDLLLSFDSPVPGAGLVAADMRVFAGHDAHVAIASLQTLDEPWTVLDNSGFVLDDNAYVEVAHKVLGAGKAYTGLAADLRGEDSRITTSTRYVGLNRQERDFNYVVRHRGRTTKSALDANGVLAGCAVKTLRGTIDFIHGCKGAEGNERETVLLVDEEVENRTVPVILCDEDDVMGNHGATIGHVRPEQRFYLTCRGLTEENLERLFVVAALEEAYLSTTDKRVREGIVRLAQSYDIAADEFVAVDEEV